MADRTRAALAQPEPEVVGPTDEELDELFTEIDQSGEPLSWRAYACAVLSRWGSAAPAPSSEIIQMVKRLHEINSPAPVSVGERPWEREGWCDEQGQCWMGDPGGGGFIPPGACAALRMRRT